MEEEELSRKYPRLYHMAEVGNWPNIQKYGLLSTTALLDLFEVTNPLRKKIESEWRSDSVTINHPVYGKAIIRDQKPMPPQEIEKCLIDMTAQQWYEFLNKKTFFWSQEDYLNRLLNAFAYKNRPHFVLIVDTQLLVYKHREIITLCRINSGF